MILAIDSSIGSAVAVVDPETEEVLGQAQSETSRGHAEVIGTLIQQALEAAGITPADITAVAAGMGPGPFTGLRIGIAAARAFAIGRGIPVVPVASHDAAALETLEQDPDAEFIIVTDARRRENAVSAYAGLANGLPNRIAGPDLLPNTEDPESYLAEQLSTLTSSERSEADSPQGPPASGLAGGSAERIRGTAGPEGNPLRDPATRSIPASYVAIIAARKIKAGTIEHIDPLYLRAPDAKVPGAVKRVSS